MKKDAKISECGRYRYWLTRTWDETRPVDTWIMLNPSTADAAIDDPTIRRCMGFSRSWEAGGIIVVNIFALRSTDPGALRKHYPTDHDHDLLEEQAIIDATTGGRPPIAAWGGYGGLLDRDRKVMQLLDAHSRWPTCLGYTKHGYPRHPLYCRSGLVPVPYKLSHAPSAP